MNSSDNILKWIIVVSVVAVVAFLGWFMYNETSRVQNPEQQAEGLPQTAQKVPDSGRTHIQKGGNVSYNSNPPTSGAHYGDWRRAGNYDEPQQDEYLVHSLEHGYIIMSYNCNAGQGGSVTPSPDQAQDCQLKEQLNEVLDEKGAWKLIVVPRPNLDVPIALTAWGYIDKMDKFDKDRTFAFIDALRDQGPEKTME